MTIPLLAVPLSTLIAALTTESSSARWLPWAFRDLCGILLEPQATFPPWCTLILGGDGNCTVPCDVPLLLVAAKKDNTFQYLIWVNNFFIIFDILNSFLNSLSPWFPHVLKTKKFLSTAIFLLFQGPGKVLDVLYAKSLENP